MKVLIAEDDSISCRLLDNHLSKWGYESVVTDNGDAALRALLVDNAPRMAILDWIMPGKDGIEVCRALRARSDRSYIYVLLLTAKSEKEDVIEGLDAGADDFLSKPFDTFELKARLNAGRRIIDLHDQLLAAQEALRIQATHDPLLGIWNRTAILAILERELARGKRDRRSVGVVMADVDHFKRVNDTHGHLVGDAVLRETARRLQASIRPYDAFGRYGGEEFLIVLPGCDATETQRLAERFRRCIGETPHTFSEGAIPVTLSVGATATEHTAACTSDLLLRTADAALYAAKDHGRNRVEFTPV